MKFTILFLPVFACLITSLSWIIEATKDVDSEMERLVGGRDATEGQFPWAAALYRDGNIVCTSSIIGETTVLTAANCVVRNGVTLPAGSFYAIANVNREAEVLRIDFESVTPHPEYSELDTRNDIAVFKTTEPITFSDTVKPICIARNDTGPVEYRQPIAMGWGSISGNRLMPRFPAILQYAVQTQVGTEECRLFPFLGLQDYKICISDNNQHICIGDYGGPLIFDDKNDDQDPVQVGVASYALSEVACGLLLPSVWTRTSFFNSFIKEVAADDPQVCEI